MTDNKDHIEKKYECFRQKLHKKIPTKFIGDHVNHGIMEWFRLDKENTLNVPELTLCNFCKNAEFVGGTGWLKLYCRSRHEEIYNINEENSQETQDANGPFTILICTKFADGINSDID